MGRWDTEVGSELAVASHEDRTRSGVWLVRGGGASVMWLKL